jgi:integrase
MNLKNEEFKRPILMNDTRILRPNEWAALLKGCPKIQYKTMLQTFLYTGMRYVELQRFQGKKDWYDGEFIHLPAEACRKKRRTQRERWVRLNNQGKMIIQYFLATDSPLPTYQSWGMNLRCWARRADLNPIGLNVKTTRKTWESWLMFYYPTQIMAITLSQGHTQTISINHYLNMPFTESDRVEIKNYVEGWIE